MNDDLKIIKKKYGEDMAQFCREEFSTILEQKGLLPKLLLDNFEVNRDLYQDIIKQDLEVEFKNYIFSFFNLEGEKRTKLEKTPKELLSDAGYYLYECHSEEEIQRFKKYYAKGEYICTFDGGRLDRNVVFFAVKKDVDQIRREDYKVPKRQDRYGTSLISIQFSRDEAHTLKITNRYNHRVNNPDATFSNNLDNIIEGLTESFAREYGLIQKHVNSRLDLEDYVVGKDGKYYKYNFERGNVYFCPNNVVIDNLNVKKYEKERYIVFDNFILNLVNKKITRADGEKDDAFVKTIGEIEKIETERHNKEKIIKLKIKNQEDVIIVLNENNQMIKLVNNNVRVIGNNFLTDNFLQDIILCNLEEVGNDFLLRNEMLRSIDFPKLRKVGDYFLKWNDDIEEINLPELEEVGYAFLECNDSLQEIDFPKLRIVGSSFLGYNETLQEVNLPNLEEVGNDFLEENRSLEEIELPKLRILGNNFLYKNKDLEEVSFPELEEVGNNFLMRNILLEFIDFPRLKKVGVNFLGSNNSLQKINLPVLETIGVGFLREHKIFDENNFRSSVEVINKKIRNSNTQSKLKDGITLTLNFLRLKRKLK